MCSGFQNIQVEVAAKKRVCFRQAELIGSAF